MQTIDRSASMPTFFDERRPHDGLTYADYLDQWTRAAEASLEDLDKDERKLLYYARYNLERSQQVHAAYEPSPALQAAVAALDAPQLWMVLTETWCGDSAYNLPVIAEAAALSDHIDLRILPRDENLDIMDQYLTGGSRSIPKLVSFTEEGNELFQWGPRPAGAVQLREELKAEGASAQEMIQHLLDWYAHGGWQEVDDELVAEL
jgi:hypothetical protein